MWQDFVTSTLARVFIYGGGAATLGASYLSLENTPHHHMLLFLTAVGGLLALIGGCLSDWGSSRAAAKLEANAAQINAKNDKIISLQESSLSFFTGGDSIVYLHFFEECGEPKVQYKIEGDESVSDVYFHAVNVVDLYKLNRQGMPSRDIDSQVILTWQVGRVRPGTPLGPKGFPFRDEQDQHFVIDIVQPNGRFVETVWIQTLQDAKRVFAYRLFHDTEKQGQKRVLKMLPHLSFTDEDFPPDAISLIEHPETLMPELIAIEPAH